MLKKKIIEVGEIKHLVSEALRSVQLLSTKKGSLSPVTILLVHKRVDGGSKSEREQEPCLDVISTEFHSFVHLVLHRTGLSSFIPSVPRILRHRERDRGR